VWFLTVLFWEFEIVSDFVLRISDFPAMLTRVLEPEVMDSLEEARDYDAMDHVAVNRTFVADFLAVWDGKGPILDAGTGTAQIPIELCLRAETAQVTGIDLAEHMLALGRENVRRAGLDQRIFLEKCDAKKLPYPTASFGVVISNSIVHHIPEPALVVAEMVRVIFPGGRLFVRDLLRPPDNVTVHHLVTAYAGTASAHQRQMFDDSLRAALSLGEIRGLVSALGFDPGTVKQTTDRHWTWTALKP
jgi:ubiquinone/menaquinone biosynthesis C-methylase UbiE